MRLCRLVGVVVVGAVVLAACGGDDDDGGADGDGSAVSSSVAGSDGSGSTVAGGDGAPEVRVVTVTPVTAGTWDPAQHRAYMAAAEAGGWNLDIAEALPYAEAEQVFDSWGAEGVDVVFSTDNGFEDALLAAAAEYPETAWVMMSGLSTTNDLPNVAAYGPDWCQIGFVQGAAGALVSSSGVVGGVGAIEIFPAQLTIEGLVLGADSAAAGTEVVTEYSGDFIDVGRATETASALMGRGADVLLGITQGGTTPQIAARVQEAGNYFIGSYDDESASAPDAVVTSVILSFEAGYTESVESWLDGSFSPTINVKGIEDGFLELTEFRLGFDELQPEVETLIDQLLSGEISFPADGLCAAG